MFPLKMETDYVEDLLLWALRDDPKRHLTPGLGGRIVRAVNSHDELVAALELAQAALYELSNEMGADDSPIWHEDGTGYLAVEGIVAALAKARGG